MEYANSKITKTVRYAIFWTFVAIFLILTPAIIMYTEGYRYDWHNGLLREMGAISIDIEPSNATVFLDGLKIQQTMPVRLKNISPRKYHIKITATGYYDWERDFEVKNKQTVYIKETGLIKKETPTILTKGDVQTLSLSPDSHYLAYTILTDKKLVAHVIDTTNSADQTLSELTAGQKYEIAWAPNNTYLSITNTNVPQQEFWIYSVGSDKKINLKNLANDNITKYQWKETSEPELFFSTKKALFTIKPNTQNVYQISTSTYIDWQEEQGQFWTLQLNTTTKQVDIIKDSFGFKSTFATLDSNTHPEINSSNPELRIVNTNNNRVLIKYTNNDNLIFVTGDKSYELTGNNFTVSPFYDWMIMWTPWELWTHTAGEEPYLLNRSGAGLRQVVPLDKYNTLALLWNDKTTILYPYYQVTHNFINTPVVAAAADTNNKSLYFISNIDKENGIWKIQY